MPYNIYITSILCKKKRLYTDAATKYGIFCLENLPIPESESFAEYVAIAEKSSTTSEVV
jgi:hypothetical protein